MIRVLSFVGSGAGAASHTKELSDRLVAAFERLAQERGEQVSYECLTGADLRVSFCRSCNSCFRTGVCPLDATDDVGSLKDKILAADVVLFGSPVYLWEMSGVAKAVLDRISFWSHRLELAGKSGMVLVTASNNHGPELEGHLRELLQFMGLAMPEGLVGLLHAKPRMDVPEESDPVIEAAAERLLAAWEDPESCLAPQQELIFKQVRLNTRQAFMRHLLSGRELGEEARVMNERRVGSYDTLAEYVRARREVAASS